MPGRKHLNIHVAFWGHLSGLGILLCHLWSINYARALLRTFGLAHLKFLPMYVSTLKECTADHMESHQVLVAWNHQWLTKLTTFRHSTLPGLDIPLNVGPLVDINALEYSGYLDSVLARSPTPAFSTSASRVYAHGLCVSVC